MQGDVRVVRSGAAVLVATLVLGAVACGSGESATPRPAAPVDDVRLNQIQVMGTHNSYRVRPPAELFDYLKVQSPELASELDYAHRPLTEQFSLLGNRQIELDVYPDPAGGRYLDRPFSAQVGLASSPVGAEAEVLAAPGTKVLHVDGIDYASTCPTFVACLTEVRDWSVANPTHLPIMILVEVKTPTFPPPAPVTGAELDALDAEIASVFPPEAVITPDDVRNGAATLRDAVTTTGWPTLAESRGKVMFALDNGGQVRDDYLVGHAGLEGRTMFASMESTDDPAAAFFKENDPLGENLTQIQDLVRQGFIVRTRADEPVVQVSANDRSRLEAALASGAQFVSSDYLEPDLSYSEYVASLPEGGVARCNPVSGPPGCDNAALRSDTQGVSP